MSPWSSLEGKEAEVIFSIKESLAVDVERTGVNAELTCMYAHGFYVIMQSKSKKRSIFSLSM